MNARLQVYRSFRSRRNQRWRWRLIASNGRNIANSGEGYTDPTKARQMGERVRDGYYRNGR